VGDTIERYEVVEKLGQGGAAQVYRVRHTQLGKDFALKVLIVRRHPDLQKRLIQEAQLQSAVDHPNVVRVFDLLEVKDSPALLMELIQGPALHPWLAEHTPDIDTVLEVFEAMVEGVAAAHALGLVHRDLKPDNVLLVQRDGGWHPKIADFGLAKMTRGDSDLGLSRTGVALGTPQYMAPEQIRDAKRVDARADIFALGCLLYLLVCGRGAFQRNTVIDIYQAIAAGDYTPPRELRSDLPEHVVRAIDGCLQVDIDARIQSCEALLEVLHDTVPSPSVPAPPLLSPPPSSAPPPRQPGRPPWARIAAVVVILIALGLSGQLIIAMAAFVWQSLGEPSSTSSGDISEGVCGGVVGDVVGFAWAGSSLRPREVGAIWTLDRDRNVREEHPTEENGWSAKTPIVCVLPKGARLTLEEAPVDVPRAVWVPVVAGAVDVD